MIRHYIIDGNNLIGKIPHLFSLQKKDGHESRQQLAYLLDKFFQGTKLKVSLHFDGYMVEGVKSGRAKIYYSDNEPADNLIKQEVTLAKNPKLICVISSDFSVKQFAKKNACTTKTSEEFYREIQNKNSTDEEESLKNSISNDEIRKLFGV